MKVISNNGNMTVFQDDNNNRVLQSYNVIIARETNHGVILDSKYYNYSVTTSRHRNEFLGVNTKQFNNQIARGLYEFSNLN